MNAAQRPPLAAVLIALAAAVWTIYDARQRRAPSYWYLIILLAPAGPLIYLVVVRWLGLTLAPGSAAQGPSALTGLAQADALERAEKYLPAERLYREILAETPESQPALHGLARCRMGAGAAREAVAILEGILTKDRTYGDYSAALDYADALWESGDRSDAIEVLERLSELSGRLNHRLALAHYLELSGQRERALSEIKAGMALSESWSPAEREQNQRWLDHAQQMLQELTPSD